MRTEQAQLSRRQAARVYRPDSRFDSGLFASVGALGRELWRFRSHIAILFSSEFRAGYRNTVFGVVWNIVLPLLPISVYVLLVSLRVLPGYEGISPAVYISFNVTLWFLFVGLINQPIQIVKSKSNAIMKTAMPLSATIASSFARLSFDTMVRAAAVIVIIVATGAVIHPSALALAPVALAGAAFSLGLGLLLSICNAIYQDVERVVEMLLRYAIFLSGVIFPLSRLGPLGWLETFNPFAVFLRAAREAVFIGSLSHPAPLIFWSAAGVLLILFSVRFFYVMEYRIRGLA